MSIRPKDSLGFELKGRIEVLRVTEGQATTLFAGKNLIADGAVDIMLGFLSRDLDNKMITYVDVGTGGDVNPATGLDTGARVAPQNDETDIRVLLYRSPIANIEPDVNTKEVVFTAVVKPEDGNDPAINEFALLSYDGTMLAHFVTPEDPGSGRAEQYEKTALMYLVIRWTMTPTLIRS